MDYMRLTIFNPVGPSSDQITIDLKSLLSVPIFVIIPGHQEDYDVSVYLSKETYTLVMICWLATSWLGLFYLEMQGYD